MGNRHIKKTSHIFIMKTEDICQASTDVKHNLPKKNSLSIFGANVDNTVNNINYHGSLSTTEKHTVQGLFWVALVLVLIISLYLIYLARRRLCKPKSPSHEQEQVFQV